MKKTLITAALAATALSANAATVLHNLAGPHDNQSGNTGLSVTFTTDGLNGGLDLDLDSVDFGTVGGPDATVYYLSVFLDADNDATTSGTTGPSLGLSTGSAMSATVNTNYDFTGVTLAANTVYTLVFSDAAGTAIAGNVRMGLINGDNDQGTEMFLGSGATRYNGSFDAPISVNMDVVPVPEPSSFALLGLGGLALLRRRRK